MYYLKDDLWDLQPYDYVKISIYSVSAAVMFSKYFLCLNCLAYENDYYCDYLLKHDLISNF